MSVPITEAELRHLLSQTAFNQHYRFELDSFAEGECAIRVPFQDAFERPGGIVGGPVFMAAADIAMWLAIATKLGPSAGGSVTVEMKTNFLAGARREDIVCRARVLKMGRRLVYGVAECANRSGKLLTHHTLTYIRGDA